VYSRGHARLRASEPADGGPSKRAGTSRPKFRIARPRAVRRVVVLIGAGVVVAAVAQSAPAAEWSIERAPEPAHSDGSGLFGVSCTSTTDCFAVGQSTMVHRGDAIPLVEHWNGAAWSIQRTPIPPDSGWGGQLLAVSCASSRACIAVGSFYSDSSSGPLTERWNGSSWSIRRTPASFDAYGLDAVSCESSSACIAVGNGQGSFAERWDGMRWTSERIRMGSSHQTVNDGLTGVSCLSGGTCAAVGSDDIGVCGVYYSDYVVPVLGFRKAGRWLLRRRPNLECSNRALGDNGLDAVSCTSTTSCTAVGTVVYRWNGHDWSIQPAPNGGDELLGVSCTSADACMAVGARSYSWNGHEWSSEPIPSPARTTAELHGVSCTSPESCVAVGGDENAAGEGFVLIEATGR
jgi:hypothetical protein